MFHRLREDIACIRERDPAARSTWEVLTCYPGLHALVLHRALPVWLPAAGAVAALLAAYAAGFTKEWLDARANAKARAAGLPLPHGVEVADWQATAWGCVPVVLPLAALQLIVFVT